MKFLNRAINTALSAFGLQIVPRSILYDWQVGRVSGNRDLRLPDEAAEYLRVDNPRLKELQERYKTFGAQASIPIVWTDEYVQSYDLQAFRGDNCYVWQASDPNCDEIHYCLTAYYVKALDRAGLLRKNIEDGLFGVHTFSAGNLMVSRDLLDSMAELHFLEKHLEVSTIPNLTVLDIGAGYGRLAYRTACSLANLSTYLCTDAVPESTFLCEYYVKFRQVDDRVRVVPLDEIATQLAENQVDLAVNIHSFSECSLEAIEWWLKLLAKNNVKYLFIVPNASDHGGVKLALNSGEDFSSLVEKHGYALQIKAPKYEDPLVQKHGVSPTHYYLYRRRA